MCNATAIRETHVTAPIAVNIADLTRYDGIIRSCMLAPVLASASIVQAEPGRFDGGAAVLQCGRTQAQAIIDVLRGYDKKAKQYAVRAYRQTNRGSWARL